MDVLNEITRFGLAVVTHWQAYMTGGIVVAILSAYERLTRKTISRRIVVIAIIAFFVVASFMAWRDQYRAAISAEDQFKTLTTPRFEGAIDTVSASPSSTKGGALVILTAHVKNIGAPSIAEFSDCSVNTSSGEASNGEFGPIPLQLGVTFGEPKPKKAETALIYPREDNLNIKGSAAPIPTGGAVSGWLYFVVNGVDENEVLQPGTVISLTVKDVRGQALRLSYAVTATNVHEGPPKNFP